MADISKHQDILSKYARYKQMYTASAKQSASS